MIKIKNLIVKSEEKEILTDINLEIDDGEKVVIFGPNGSGKSTLFKIIMGLGEYNTVKGEILVNGRNILDKEIDERVKLGLGYVGQKSIGIRGVTVEDLISQYDFKYEDIRKAIEELDIEDLLSRDLNYTLSGGEIKRIELFTLSLLENIHTYLLDELDSGVDLENILKISEYLKKESNEKSLIITTHTGAILQELDMDTAYVMIKGQIVCKDTPKKVWKCIKEKGFDGCVNCDMKKNDES